MYADARWILVVHTHLFIGNVFITGQLNAVHARLDCMMLRLPGGRVSTGSVTNAPPSIAPGFTWELATVVRPCGMGRPGALRIGSAETAVKA